MCVSLEKGFHLYTCMDDKHHPAFLKGAALEAVDVFWYKGSVPCKTGV